MKSKMYINDGWKFSEKFTNDMLYEDFDDSSMTEVRIPHTCKETPFNYFDEEIYQMVSAYKKVINVPKEWEGKSVSITFEGNAHDSEVYVNGRIAGFHHCGYTAFTIDLSKYLKYGEDNILIVKLDSNEKLNIPPFGFVIDYMTYGGIYRDVYLEVKEKVNIDDVFVKTVVTKEKRGIITKVKINNQAEKTYKIQQYIRAKDSEEWKYLGEKLISLEAETKYITQNVLLWDINEPNLYEIKTILLNDEKQIDEKIIRTGFRSAKFKKDGFYLNGKKLKIRGLNRHQSYPYVGYAMPEAIQKNDADILKYELGLNAVRTSHYPQSHYFLDRCDEIGLLVFTELPGWQHIGNEEWKEQAIVNVADMVKQYRNHTSIILWGVRINESVDDDEFYEKTNMVARELDPYRQTGGVRALAKSNLLEDVYTYNDFLHNGRTKGCEKKSKITSDVNKPYLISEYGGHMFPTKAYDSEEHMLSHALRHATVLDEVAKQNDISGSFGWCMCDYNTHKDFGSGDRICYHGVMDMFRNHKMAASIYSMQSDEKNVLLLSSTMDIGEHPACVRGDTYIFTNGDSVKMYKNDMFIKEYTAKDSDFKYLKHGPIIIDDYIGDAILQGEDFTEDQARDVKEILNLAARNGIADLPKKAYLLAAKLVARYHMKPSDAVEYFQKYVGDWGGKSTVYKFEMIKDGSVKETLTVAPMKKVMIKANADHTKMCERNSYDVALVRIKAVDENDNQLRFYNEVVTLMVEGDIEIIGPKVISLEGGMGGTFVKTTKKNGQGKLIVKSRDEVVEIEFIIKEEK